MTLDLRTVLTLGPFIFSVPWLVLAVGVFTHCFITDRELPWGMDSFEWVFAMGILGTFITVMVGLLYLVLWPWSNLVPIYILVLYTLRFWRRTKHERTTFN